MMSSWMNRETNNACIDPDPNFRYRFDSLTSLKALDSFFSPKRWDQGASPFPHKALIEAANSRGEAQGIFRISFWVNEDFACRRSSVVAGESHLLLRVRCETLRRVFSGWNFEEDDHLPGEADLIWNELPVERDIDGFLDTGIPLSELEVWTPSGWTNWHFAEPLRPMQERMATLGWSQTIYRDAWGAPNGCFWRILRHPTIPANLCALVVKDTDLGGASMMSNDEAIDAVARLIFEQQPYAAGVLSSITVVEASPGPTPSIISQDWAVSWSHIEASTHHARGLIGKITKLLSSSTGAVQPRVECRPQLSKAAIQKLGIAAGLHRSHIVKEEHWFDPIQYR